MNKIIILLFLAISFVFKGQTFDAAAGQAGSLAISKDSSVIVNWASGIQLTRGYLNVANPTLGFASFGIEQNALNVAEGDGISVVSLGDGGVATLTFANLITNFAGPDFAVFENGFADDYTEFAHVEVSSDGINFYRFPSISETPLDVQIDNFTYSDCRYVLNLAGKYRKGYGVPFDLEELINEPGLNVNAITHVRLIDVVGSINPLYGTMDGLGVLINDPYPTEFESGGFDLDAVAVLHETPLELKEQFVELNVYPNPTNGIISIKSSNEGQLKIVNSLGQILYEQILIESVSIDLSLFEGNIFIVQFISKNINSVYRVIRHL